MGQNNGSIRRCCLRLKLSFLKSVREDRIHEGLGAVGVFVGVSLLCIGVVFTIVNAQGKDGDTLGIPNSLGYTGPVLISVAIICIVCGYLLNNAGNIARIWTYVKKRKQFPYIDYDHYYGNDVNRNLFSVVCFTVMKACFRIKDSRRAISESVESSASGEQRPSTLTRETSKSRIVCETDSTAELCRRRKSSSSDVKLTSRRSHSLPLISTSSRYCKVSPDTSGSLSDSSCDIPHDGTFEVECVV